MSVLLYIKANPKPVENSFSLTVAESFINAYKENNKNDTVIEFDVFKENVQSVDNDVLNAWQKLRSGISFSDLSDIEQEKVQRMNKVLDEFISADKYVIASPMWNFSIPPVLKNYVDNILIAGKTFKYTENGAEGLLENKKMLHVQASGGVYDGESMNHSSVYLAQVFKFMGVDDIDSILIQGVNLYPDKAESMKTEAIIEAIIEAKRIAAVF